MPAKKPKHVGPHKYQRIEWGKNGTHVWRCVLPDCTHYLHKEMVKGKRSLCHKCGATFLMTTEHILREKPKCENCIDRKDRGLSLNLDKILEGL